MVAVSAPAKLNLILEVLGSRSDGYHDIVSVAQTIDLSDTLCLEPCDGLEFVCSDPGWDPGRSLIGRAVRLMRQETGRADGVKVYIIRRIPLVSGLSGDSSAAAAMLMGLNRLWGLGLKRPQLAAMASRLGSDTAFFLHGGTALMEGRGEVVTSLPPVPPMHVVLFLPFEAQSGKTGRIYGSLPSSSYSDGKAASRLVGALKAGGVGEADMGGYLYNGLAEAALASYEGLADCRRFMLEAGAGVVNLAGSGPTLFVLTEDKSRAEAIYAALEGRGLWRCLTRTLSAVDNSDI